MNPPMTLDPDPTIPRIRPWSRGNRLFPCEKELGAYLPVDKFSDAVLATGYSGPWSLEVFNDSLSNKDAKVPQEHATRAIKGLRKAVQDAYTRTTERESREQVREAAPFIMC